MTSKYILLDERDEHTAAPRTSRHVPGAPGELFWRGTGSMGDWRGSPWDIGKSQGAEGGFDVEGPQLH